MSDLAIESVAEPTAENESQAAVTWSTAILCEASQQTARCVAELRSAGLLDIRLFADSGTMVPESCAAIPVTVPGEHLSAPARERLIVAELLMRSPSADGIVLIPSGVSGRGIDHWLNAIRQHIGTTASPSLYVDSVALPGRFALTSESAKGYLADLEGLCSTFRQRLAEHAFGKTLTEWAGRTGALVVEIPITGDIAAPPAAQASSPGVHGGSAAGDQVNRRIQISGARVSIVIPTWNCADYLEACLRSVLRQTTAVEVIVVDDGSTDATGSILEAFDGRITLVRHARQRGANAARNTGIAAASGDFIAFADADNEYAATWIERLLQAVLADASAGLAYCGFLKQSLDGSIVRSHGAPWDLDTLWFGNYIDMSSVVRRAALPTDGLQEGFRPFDDWRLWLKLAQRGWRGIWVPEHLYVKHVRGAGKTQQSIANLDERGRDLTATRREFAALVGLDSAISVVIPASGGEDLTERCLTHLGWYCGVPFQVVYVDNGSPLPVLDAVAGAADRASISLRIVRNAENRGFTHAVNQGIKASGDANVLLLNNDCFIGPGCVENLARELRFNDRAAAAGPLTGDAGRQSLKNDDLRGLARLPDDVLDELDDPVRMSFRLSQKLRSVAWPALSFYCALLRGEALARHGRLDARFESGLAADDEWCFRMRDNGRDVRLVLNAYAAHLHRSTFQRLQIDRDSLQQDARELLGRVLAGEQDVDR